jgi:hypothetical protein
MPLALEINEALFGGSPFAGFDAASYPMDLEGSCEDTDVFDTIIDQLKPSLIIHVGCWKGKSTQYLLNRAMRHQDASVICVDTWSGSSEHWMVPEKRLLMDIQNGRPRIFDHFMANVIHAGLEDRVVPMPMGLHEAAEVLACMQIGGVPLAAPLVFLDTPANLSDVETAIDLYWPKVFPGGLMVGAARGAVTAGGIDAVGTFRSSRAGEIEQTGELKSRWYAQRKPA